MAQPFIISKGTPETTVIFGEDGKPMPGIISIDIHIDANQQLVIAKGTRAVVAEPLSDGLVIFEMDGDNVKVEEFAIEYLRLGPPEGWGFPLPSEPIDPYISKHGGRVVTDEDATTKSQETNP